MESINISFSANGQQLTGGGLHCASNTVHYIIADFELGDGWQGFDSVRAVWSNDFKCISTVLDPDGSCTVPHEVLERRGKVSVNLVGSILEDDELTDRLTTYPVLAITVDANAKICGTETAEVTPSQFEQFVQIVKDEVAKIKDIDRAELNEDYTLTFYFSDGTETTVGPIRGEQGETGNGIASAVLNADYTLTLNFTDGTHYTTPPIRGAQGVQGETGNGIDRIELTDTTGAVKTYTIYFTDGSTYDFEVTDGEVTNAVLDEATIVQTNSDNVPYLFRPSGGDVRTGRKEFDTIVGGTVAWNQLVPDFDASNWSLTANVTSVSDGELHVQPTETWQGATKTNVSVIAGHKYFESCVGRVETSGTSISIGDGLLGVHTIGSIYSTSNTTIATIVSATTTVTGNYNVGNRTGVANYYLSKPQLIDLTQMFGSVIADYIYSLEHATAGAGVAWFRRYFPNDYYPYDPGTLRSVEGVSAHETVGFNQWDEEWKNGWWNYQTGVFTASSSYFACKSKIAVFPNTKYYWKCPTNVREIQYYDANGEPLGSRNSYAEGYTNTTFTTPDGCYYLTFYFGASYGTTYKNDICINLSDASLNGTYKPYTKHSYPLDNTLTLRGIPKLDNGKLYYDGDTYESDGTVTRKYGIVDLGTLTWSPGSTMTSGVYRKRAEISGIKRAVSASAVGNAVCSKYANVTANDTYMLKVGMCVDNATDSVYIYDENYTSGGDQSDFKTAMSGVYLVYELATPTTETAEPYTNPQVVDPSGTEEYVGSPIPVGHETDYPMTLTDTMPTANGNYTLNLTVANGKRSVSWT